MQSDSVVQYTHHRYKFNAGHKATLHLWIPGDQVPVVYLILPAMGVKCSFYRRFAEDLAYHGVAVATNDWRGMGDSSLRADSSTDWGYEDLIDDVRQIATWLRRRIQFHKLYIIGHSMGGQVGHMTAARYEDLIDGVFSVMSSDPYYKWWGSMKGLVFRYILYLIAPTTRIVGHFPGYIFGFANRESRTVMKDWVYAAHHGQFRDGADGFDYSEGKWLYSGLIIALHLSGDQLAPPRAVKGTIAQFQNAKPKALVLLNPISPSGEKINHFNWVKYNSQVIDELIKWLQQ